MTEEERVSAPSDREKPISVPPFPPAVSGATELFEINVEPPELLERRRLAQKPNIDRLPDGTVTLPDGTVLPLFDVGDRIIVERRTAFLKGTPWLDTCVYEVRSIDDASGLVSCTEPEYGHFSWVGYKDPLQRFKLCPKKGNPWRVAREKPRRSDGVEQQLSSAASSLDGGKKRRGRPKGSKNRPREEIEAEKQLRRDDRRRRREKRSSRRPAGSR